MLYWAHLFVVSLIYERFEAGHSNRLSTRELRYRADSFFHVFSLICYDTWTQRMAIELTPLLLLLRCLWFYSRYFKRCNHVMSTYEIGHWARPQKAFIYSVR